MPPVDPLFQDLIGRYSEFALEHPRLRAVSAAQWLHETESGTSGLAQRHYNFARLPWHVEMTGFAHEAHYDGPEGRGSFCRFCTLDDFLRGYWRYLELPPFAELADHIGNEEDFIRFVGMIMAPTDAQYAGSVLARVVEARELLGIEASEMGEDPEMRPIAAVVVLDPGHGGTRRVGGSSPNNATSPSGVAEKNMTLELARLAGQSLERISTENSELDIEVHLTRETDMNRALATRANVARDRRADVFLSIHFNGFNGVARGVETLVLPIQSGNVNLEEDRALAGRVNRRVFEAIRARDPMTRDRGVKEQGLGVLRDVHLGNTQMNHRTRAALVEVEFIDVPAVDELLNTGANADQIKREVGEAIAEGIVDDLIFHG